MNGPAALRGILIEGVQEVKQEDHIFSFDLLLFLAGLYISKMLILMKISGILSTEPLESSIPTHFMSRSQSVGSFRNHTRFIVNSSDYKSKPVYFFQISGYDFL